MLGLVAGVALLYWAQTYFSRREFSLWSLALLILGAACVIAAALSVDYRPLIASQEESAPLPREASPPREWTRMRMFSLLFAAVFTLMAFALNDRNMFSPRGVITWWLAILLFLYVWWQPAARTAPLKQRLRELVTFRRDKALRIGVTLALFLLVAGVAGFFRLYRLNVLPGDAVSIQADIGDNVSSILKGHFWIYMPKDIGEGGLLYFTAGAVKVFGVVLDYNAIKVATALAGLAGVGATYLLLKEVFSDRTVALVGALFMAVAHWSVTLSRASFMSAAAPFWAAITLLFLVRVLKRNRTNDYLLCGLSAGLGLYFYQGLRVMPFIIVACLVVRFVTAMASWHWRESFGIVGRSILLGLTLLIVFTPMARSWNDNPAYYMQAVRTRAAPPEPVGYQAPARFAENLKKAFWMFNWDGDAGLQRNIPRDPALDEGMAALLLAGAGIGIAVWFRYGRGLFPYVAIAFTALLLPSALSLAFPGEVPDFGRASGAIPLAFGFVALPVCLGLSCVRRSISGWKGTVAASLVLAAVVAALGAVNYHWYFHDYSNAYASTSSGTARIVEGIEGVRSRDNAPTVFYAVAYPPWTDWRGVELMLGQPDWLRVVYPVPQTPPPSQGSEVYLVYSGDQESRQQLQQLYPRGTTEWQPGESGIEDGMLFFFTSPDQ
jgi:hypothetical protein